MNAGRALHHGVPKHLSDRKGETTGEGCLGNGSPHRLVSCPRGCSYSVGMMVLPTFLPFTAGYWATPSQGGRPGFGVGWRVLWHVILPGNS